jgi:hypothetical protein
MIIKDILEFQGKLRFASAISKNQAILTSPAQTPVSFGSFQDLTTRSSVQHLAIFSPDATGHISLP